MACVFIKNTDLPAVWTIALGSCCGLDGFVGARGCRSSAVPGTALHLQLPTGQHRSERDFPVEEELGKTDLTLTRQHRAVNPTVSTVWAGPGAGTSWGSIAQWLMLPEFSSVPHHLWRP